MQNTNPIKTHDRLAERQERSRTTNVKTAELGAKLSALLPGWCWSIAKPCGQYQPNKGRLTEGGGMSLLLELKGRVLTVVCTFPDGPTGILRGAMDLPSPFNKGKYRANISLKKSPERIAKEIRSRLISRYRAAYAAALAKISAERADARTRDASIRKLADLAGPAGQLRNIELVGAHGRHNETSVFLSLLSPSCVELRPHRPGIIRIAVGGAYIPYELAEVICRWAAENDPDRKPEAKKGNR